MLTRAQLLEPLARHRTNEVVVTTMSVTRPWGRLSDHDLDFASADSAMGHAADLALGIALARPNRTVVCLNADGSMLMTLGTLATVAGVAATNLVLIVVDNGTYEITGSQPVPSAGSIDYAAMAEAAGFPRVFGSSVSTTPGNTSRRFRTSSQHPARRWCTLPSNLGPRVRSTEAAKSRHVTYEAL